MPSLKIKDHRKQCPLRDQRDRPDKPPFTKDHMLPVGPFRTWLRHQLTTGFTMTELAALVQLNERSIRRILDSGQKEVSLDLVDWALIHADGRTQMWHLYPEVYESNDQISIDIDMEISA